MGNINISVSSNHWSFCIISFGEHQLQPIFDDTPYLELTQNTYLLWRKNTRKFPSRGYLFHQSDRFSQAFPGHQHPLQFLCFLREEILRRVWITSVVSSPKCNPSTVAVFPEHGKSQCKTDTTDMLVWIYTWTHCKLHSFSFYLDLLVPTWAAEALLSASGLLAAPLLAGNSKVTPVPEKHLNRVCCGCMQLISQLLGDQYDFARQLSKTACSSARNFIFSYRKYKLKLLVSIQILILLHN